MAFLGTAKMFDRLDALSRAPFQADADLMVEVDLRTHLRSLVEIEHETFVPLVIDEVLGARFNPEISDGGGVDIPPHIFRLSKIVRFVKA